MNSLATLFRYSANTLRAALGVAAYHVLRGIGHPIRLLGRRLGWGRVEDVGEPIVSLAIDLHPTSWIEPEKPKGYNDAVMGWFYRGPEHRVRTVEFTDAFAERIHSTLARDYSHRKFFLDETAADRELQRRALTFEWAERFRQAARDLPAEPEPGVHPMIHEAMRQSFITQAELLEAEAEQL